MDLITREVASTYTPGVLRGLGAFGGLFELPAGMRRPVLAASTDGVGTKTVLARRYAAEPGVLEGIGRDLVNHCVNDVLVQGATPLFFLDYVEEEQGRGALHEDVVHAVVHEVAADALEDPGLGGVAARQHGLRAYAVGRGGQHRPPHAGG